MTNILEPKQIILRKWKPAEYRGKESHLVLNLIAKELYEAILDNCGIFEKSALIQIFYDLFDESCYNFLKQEYYIQNDISQIYKGEKSPTIYRYLLETTILSSEIYPSKRATKADILSLILGAHMLTQACAYSDYLHRNDFAGGFSITQSGEIIFQRNELMRESEIDYIGKMSLLSEKIRPDITKLELGKNGTYKRESLVKEAIPHDSLFRKTYGLNLSTIIGTAESIIFDITKLQYGVEVIPQNTLLKKIRKHTPYEKAEIKKALQFLSINKTLLSKDYQYFRLNDALVSISRRPIIHLFDDNGEKGNVVYLGPCALLRAIMLLFADIDRGILKLGDVAEHWEKEKGPQFEENTRLALSKRGFRVIRVTDPPPHVGEIDAVACYEKKQILLIIEAKAPKLDLARARRKFYIVTLETEKITLPITLQRTSKTSSAFKLSVSKTKSNGAKSSPKTKP